MEKPESIVMEIPEVEALPQESDPDKDPGIYDTPMDGSSVVNVASYLRYMAQTQPYTRAVVYPEGWDEQGRVAYTHLTFKQLDQLSDRIAHGLESVGITRGTRTILMVMPSLDFFALTFAMFKVGAVPVIVDPGMGRERMLQCLGESKAEAFIGIPMAHAMRVVYRKYFKTVKVRVTVGKRWFWGGPTLNSFIRRPWAPFKIAQTRADDMAAILFTTGSTGPAKGVVYTHAMFDAQVRYIGSHFQIRPGEVDLPTFPLFALFDPALGMTAIIPDMDPTRPAEADPVKIIEAIEDHGVTNMFASPALLNVVGRFGKDREIKLPTLKRVISAGAPVSPANIEQFSSMLEGDAEVHTPYGATEAMPVLSIGSREILEKTRKFSELGYGMCVGRPLPGLDVRIIRITDDPIETWSDDLEVPIGDIGEITVMGPQVSQQYFQRPTDDALSKIRHGNGIRHRMGDLGWRDKQGRIWFCGRKNHRVITEEGPMYTIPCEAIFNNHPAVFRSALVGVGKKPHQKPVICIELEAGGKGLDLNNLKNELLNLAARNEMTKSIKTILFKDRFEVDIRHNSKIFREKIAQWAETQLEDT